MPRRIAADDEARGRRFYEHQDSLPRETERNPGFLSRIGAARDGTDEDKRVSAAFSLIRVVRDQFKTKSNSTRLRPSPQRRTPILLNGPFQRR
jgi:hypothetical protein